MAEESTLRQAISKITDWPAAAATTPAPRAQNAGTPGTSVALVNDVSALPPDPFAAELATLQASNADLAAQIAGMTTPTTTDAATVTDPETGAALVEPGATLGYSDYYAGNEAALDASMYRGDSTDAGVGLTWPGGTNPYEYRNEYNQYVLDNDKAWSDYYKATGNKDITYEQYWGGNEEALEREFYHDADNKLTTGENQNWGSIGNPYAYSNEYNAYVAGGTPAVSGAVAVTPAKAPVNPGARAPWQASQQYWKDLAAYTGK